ncbi:phosphate regulon sensor histidine kinase PhoR [Luteimonas sp. MC1750]|uniref:phosphate regulon sensor histidine kinase PhoR n=1 Tax=Luteimonas sp. MC1750 TaxID=2799326 RepID=UPI0018F08776|nr:phosphate regulon sensor histidine kinase PhoR [Luteimonas sp. MC1750]MBJ6983094.1 phosphate regulon sensor histidine kinase PhoR [Luteimonas sp. MC1750]QQO05194.1 phosphate regulon sensor histidine kinase PhoR [Luteimonas sp. MC1750]
MPPTLQPPWQRTLATLALVLVASLLVGLAVGHPWPALALGSLALLAGHLLRLQRITHLLDARVRLPPPRPGGGAWTQVERLLHRARGEVRGRERRLVEMMRAYRAVAAALPDALVVVDRNTQRLIWCNAAAGTLLGLRYPRDKGASLVERLQPLPLSHWLSAGRHAEPIVDAASPADPAIRISLRLIPYSDALWLLVARDVGKLMRLEQMRRDFVANVSHELRTPLTVVHGYLDMLDPADSGEWEPIIGEMRRQSQRMTQLVEDLLALSRLEAQDALVDEDVAVGPMLSTLRREAEALSQGRHAIVVEDLAGVDLLGSGRELHSAFSNLVANAVRYTPSGGRIAIRFAPAEAGGVALTVEDSGYGIPESHLPRLTERFYRVSSSRTRETGGTGLGLAIVKHVLQLHQARLDITSEVGRGSTFTCRFGAGRVIPRSKDSHEHPQDPHASRQHA